MSRYYILNLKKLRLEQNPKPLAAYPADKTQRQIGASTKGWALPEAP